MLPVCFPQRTHAHAHACTHAQHRGRLSVLVNVIRKPMRTLFREFEGNNIDMDKWQESNDQEDWSSSGDVKYHLGTQYTRKYLEADGNPKLAGKEVNLELLPNPSHLEAVNPLVMGNVKAKMHYKGDKTGDKSFGVLLHGDAAFAGQGVVYETMQFAGLENYGTGGTIHIVANNQVGFTTDPWDSRTTQHPSDIGKGFDAPIFHVNADDPEAVCRVMKMAYDYR